jgi:hypothetical protein
MGSKNPIWKPEMSNVTNRSLPAAKHLLDIHPWKPAGGKAPIGYSSRGSLPAAKHLLDIHPVEACRRQST